MGLLEGDAHGGKYYRELLIFTANLCLSCNLGCQVVMRHTGGREDRKLLAADQGVQTINGRYAGLNKLLRIASGCRVHRQAVDIPSFVRKNLRAAVDWTSQTVKDTAQHILRYTQLHGSSQKTYFTVG